MLAVVRARPHTTAWCLAHVEAEYDEAKVFATLLLNMPLPVTLEASALPRNIDGASIASFAVVVNDRSIILWDPGWLPKVGVIDDGELEALASVDREHLNGLGVGFESTTPLLGACVVASVGDPLPQPRGERGDPEMLGGDLCVEKLADMAEVGESPLPIDGCEHASWEARRGD